MNGRMRVRLATTAALAAAFALWVATAAFGATPTRPVIRDVFVTPRASLATTPTVTVQWLASTDASGHAVVYDVYRDVIPITSSTILSRELTPVASGLTGTSVLINAASAETTQSYVWFYAVQARDSLGAKSAPSYSMAPNVHGNRSDPNQISCQRCHQVHGNYGPYRPRYDTKESCYFCHGSTGASFATGAKSTFNTEASFFDTGTVVAGSKHRNAYMTSTKQDCTACHTPHRSPFFYDATGVYVASLSYRRMLRIEYWPRTYEYYSRNDNPAGNTFCFSCHGSSAVTWNSKTIDAQQAIGVVGGPGAYGASGGDHNYAGYASTAHGPATVLTNTTDPNPGIQCLACHNKHASRADKLVDYRSQNTTASQAGGAELCFACHSNASTDTRISGSTRPFAWNGRDVRAQFTDTTTYKSRHPYQIVAGSWITDTMTVLAHTTKDAFDTYTLVNATTTDVAGGEIVLSQYYPTIDPPAETYLFAHDGGTQVMDQYRPDDNAWDTSNYGRFNPPNNGSFNTASGSVLFSAGGKVYVTRPTQTSPQITAYTPPAGSGNGTWASIAITFNSVFGAGAQSAVNAGTSVVYISAGGGRNEINWFRYDNNTENNMVFAPGGTVTNLGAGSGLAYAPAANRLFVLRRNGTDTGAGIGNLYYLSNPGVLTGNQNFINTNVQVTRNTANTDYNRLAYFRDGSGVEYIMMIGIDSGGANDSVIVSNLGGAVAKTDLNKSPFGAALADGCDLKWDGVDGGYLYAIRGGANTSMARIRIPASSAQIAGNWGNWETLAATQWNQDAGAGIAFAIADPGPYTGPLSYYSSGSARSTDITAPVAAKSWGTLSWTEIEPANTSLGVTVEGFDGSTWQTLVANAAAGPVDLSGYSTTSYPRIRLTANLASSTGVSTPQLLDWTVTAPYDRYATTVGSLTCVNCHNVHYVGRGGSSAWDMSRASDPDNTKLASPASATTFCLRCHDADGPASAETTAAKIVPYIAAFRDVAAPFFPGWNKSATNVDFASSGHRATTINRLVGQFGCETCHDPHASQNQRLTGITASGGSGSGHLNVARANTTSWSEQALCYGCHDGRRTGICSSAGCHAQDLGFLNVSAAFAGTFRHPVELSGRHSDTETASQLGSTNRHAECVDCHDPHATRRGRHTLYSSRAGEVLRGAIGVKPSGAWPANWTAVPSAAWTTERLDGDSADYEAYLCFKCHSSYSGQPFTATRSNNATYTSTDQALEFNPSNFSYHNVLGQSVGMQSNFTFVDSGGTTRTVTWAVPTNSFFVSGSSWTVNSMMTCTDCHTNSTASAKGPHGSSVSWLLDPAYPTDWKTAYLQNTANGMNSTTVICAKCHDLNGPAGQWSNNVHSTGDHQGSLARGGCIRCHIKIPHGWKRPRLLVRVDADGIYSGASSGLTRVGTANITLNNGVAQWSKNNCTTNCGGHSAITPFWP